METKKMLREFSTVIALAAIWGVFAFLSPSFLSARNLSMLMIEVSTTALLSLGMLLIILPDHIDLSVGSGVGLIGGIASVLVFVHGWAAPLAMLVALLAALAIWASMGAIVVKQQMPPFIITLGGLLVFKGAFWLVIHNSTVPVAPGGSTNLYSLLTTYYLPAPAGFALAALCAAAFGWTQWSAQKRLAEHHPEAADMELAFLKWLVVAQGLFLFVLVMNRFRGLPLPVVILGVATLAIAILTNLTRFGRYLYAIGGNPEAAVMSGIPVDKVLIGAYAIMGIIVALAGFLQTAYAGASTTTVGDLMELDAVAACVIGGTSLFGGRGTALGCLFGALIMASLLNGMTLMAVSPELKFIARGLVLSLAVWLDTALGRP